MMIPSEFSTAAALGTWHAQYKQPSVPQSLYEIFPITRKLEDEEVLLRIIAGMQLRRKAGYHPEKLDPSANEPCVKLPSRGVRDSDAINILKSMVIDGIHSLGLIEWCNYASLTGQHIAEELIPDILTFGDKEELMREHLLSGMGDRALWLARNYPRKEWQWVLKTRVYPPRRLILHDRWKETIIIEDLYDTTHQVHNHPALWQLATAYFSPWTDELTEVFLYFLRIHMLDRKYVYTIDSVVWAFKRLAYFFPLSRSSELLELLHHKGFAADHFGEVFDFRYKMIQALSRGSR